MIKPIHLSHTKRKSGLILVWICCWILTLPAQNLTLDRSVLANAGDYLQTDTLEMSYTLGETVVEKVETFNGQFILTQGFQQHDDILLSLPKGLQIKLDYQIFPNPVTEILMVKLSTDKPIELELGIFDLRGRKTSVPSQKFLLRGAIDTQFNLIDLADGFYLLKLQDDNGATIYSFKIQKVH